MTKDHIVRQAARALATAIIEAEAAGYRVSWPANAAGLGAIGISETGRVAVLSSDNGPGLVPGTVEETPGDADPGQQEPGSDLPPTIGRRRRRAE